MTETKAVGVSGAWYILEESNMKSHLTSLVSKYVFQKVCTLENSMGECEVINVYLRIRVPVTRIFSNTTSKSLLTHRRPLNQCLDFSLRNGQCFVIVLVWE